jgi:AcrR family transcriptional regulator
MLGADAVVIAALEIAAESHVDAVTLREVARRLHTGQSSLYVWVPNRRALLRLMLARALAPVRLPTPDPARWDRQLVTLIGRVRAALDRYPGLAGVMLDAVPSDPAGLRIVDRYLALMRAGGVPDRVAVYAVDTIDLFLAASGYEQAVRGSRAEGVDVTAEPDRRDGAGLSAFFAGQDPAVLPEVVRLAPQLGRGSPRVRFLAGVETIVAGLVAAAR